MKSPKFLAFAAMFLITCIEANANSTLVSTNSVPGRRYIRINDDARRPEAEANKCVIRIYVDNAVFFHGTIGGDIVLPDPKETEVTNPGYVDATSLEDYMTTTLENDGSLPIAP
ncbi:MAG: hypothetical protein H6550_04140 [Chitinophagales bacterium]|nr:hypothetical protein [Chitinophagales bacterium]